MENFSITEQETFLLRVLSIIILLFIPILFGLWIALKTHAFVLPIASNHALFVLVVFNFTTRYCNKLI